MNSNDLQEMAVAPPALTHDQEISAEQKVTFVELFRQNGNVSQTCREIGIQPSRFRYWLSSDESFREFFEEARDQFSDELEGVATVRALAGSDKMLEILLKANRPNKYRESVKVQVDQRATLRLDFSGMGGDAPSEDTEDGSTI